jgi:hypothetical protein
MVPVWNSMYDLHFTGPTRQILRPRINWVRIVDYDKSIETMPVIVEVQDQMYQGAALIRNRRSANKPAEVSEKD